MRRFNIYLSILFALCTFVFQAFAHEFKTGTLVIHHPAANATTGNVGVGYFSVMNAGPDADRLLAVSAPEVSDKIELHEMSMDGGVMKMREIDALNLPAGVETSLSPSAVHVMFRDLKKPLAEGQKFPGILTFEKAGEVAVEFAVEPVGTLPAGHEHH